MDNISSNIANNLRGLRIGRSWSQDQLAQASGVPRPTLSYLESGEANPTIQVLLRLAQSLQVSLQDLIGTPRSECRHFPAAQLPVHKRGESTIRKLLPDSLPGVEFDRFELPKGARLAGIPHRQGTREYLTCEAGSIELHVAGEAFRLEPGDVMVFRGDQRHSYVNIGPKTAVGYSVVLF